MQIIKNELSKEIQISNIVTTADLKQKINIKKFNDFPWGIYDQVFYNGICGYVKTPEMKGRVILFTTGKMISVGSISIKDSINKLNQAKFFLLQANLVKDIKLEPCIRNMIAVTSFDKLLNLKKLTKNLPNSIYEPKKFPSLRYKIKKGLSLLIFSLGKVVITGAKSIQDFNYANNKLKKILNL